MTMEESTRPPDAAPEGRTVDGSQLCGAPDCWRPLAEHMPDNGNNGRVLDVRGVIVGSVACAVALDNSCPVCARTGPHSCTQPGSATIARLTVQIQLPRSTRAVA